MGLRIRLDLASWPSYLALMSKRGATQMGWRGWHADFPDPLNFFEPLLTTAAIRDEGSQNASFFSSPVLDELCERARVTRDPDERLRILERAEALVSDEAPLVPVYTNRSFQIWHPYLRGYRPHPVVPLRVRDVWLTEAGP